MRPLPPFLFDIFALSLPRGHGFGHRPPGEFWQSEKGHAIGAITQDDRNGLFGVLVMRRREDDVWEVDLEVNDLRGVAEARALAGDALASDERLKLKPGQVRRPALFDVGTRLPSESFKLLVQPSHQRAAFLLNQLYLALPNPDANWASDCQTGNFHTRLFEAILIACFREQGVLVTQPAEAPDFHLENRRGDSAWVEAVTANPSKRFEHVGAEPTIQPEDLRENLLGPAAVRFAKTLGSKLQRRYDLLPHVAGEPFALALADFHAPSSMVWSREALMTYLYGMIFEKQVLDGHVVVAETKVDRLLGNASFPAGLFANADHAELSAVIFTNASTLGKLNRVAVSAGGAVDGLRYVRYGQFFDRAPGAHEGIGFALDVTSHEYRRLWGLGYEPWSVELEVFHNPYARHPFPRSLLPEAIHWFEDDGEIVSTSFYEHHVLWSQTLILNERDPMPTYERIPTYFEELAAARRAADKDQNPQAEPKSEG